MKWEKFYQNKKVLITGHTGFKGAWLSLWLRELGADVTGYALSAPTDPNLFQAAQIKKHIRHIHGDIRDFKKLDRVIQTLKPKIIFHLAAQSLVRVSYDKPRETFETNVQGTAYLLESLRRRPFDTSVLIVTSDKCYLNDGRKKGYTEKDALGGSDPYSQSKALAEMVTALYRDSFFKGTSVKVASARAGNVIGGGDWALDRIVPDAIKALKMGKPVPVRNPAFTRPWQHVLEPLKGYLMLAQALASGQSKYRSGWNLGPDKKDVVPVAKLVDEIIHCWGQGKQKQQKQKTHKKESTLLQLDCSKAKRKLGYEPVWHWREAVKETVEWYREYLKKPSLAAKLCRRQIQKFTASR